MSTGFYNWKPEFRFQINHPLAVSFWASHFTSLKPNFFITQGLFFLENRMKLVKHFVSCKVQFPVLFCALRIFSRLWDICWVSHAQIHFRPHCPSFRCPPDSPNSRKCYQRFASYLGFKSPNKFLKVSPHSSQHVIRLLISLCIQPKLIKYLLFSVATSPPFSAPVPCFNPDLAPSRLCFKLRFSGLGLQLGCLSLGLDRVVSLLSQSSLQLQGPFSLVRTPDSYSAFGDLPITFH